MRCFFGVFPPASVQRNIHLTVSDAAGSAFRLPAAENLHLTLLFVGEVDEVEVARLREDLGGAASRSSPFDVEVGGLGAFPPRGRARVIYLELLQ